jgi:hypothetical protein
MVGRRMVKISCQYQIKQTEMQALLELRPRCSVQRSEYVAQGIPKNMRKFNYTLSPKTYRLISHAFCIPYSSTLPCLLY